MKHGTKRHIVVALALSCTAGALIPAIAEAQETPVAVEESVSGVLTTPPPLTVVVEPPAVTDVQVTGEIDSVTVQSPEEEDLTAGVNVADPGPIVAADPGVVDQTVVSSVGTLPDYQVATEFSMMAGDGAVGGECTANAAAPGKNQMKIETTGSISCPTLQRSLSISVCIDVRQAGGWEPLTCKPKTASNMRTISKKASTFCVKGRFFYRSRVYGSATSANGAKQNIPTDTAVTGSRIACM